jgi:hypothetical protein
LYVIKKPQYGGGQSSNAGCTAMGENIFIVQRGPTGDPRVTSSLRPLKFRPANYLLVASYYKPINFLYSEVFEKYPEFLSCLLLYAQATGFKSQPQSVSCPQAAAAQANLKYVTI